MVTWYFSTNLGLMKHSVAPLSKRAFVSASWSRVYSEMGTLINQFQARYTEFVL
jgi:hypothetical protein